MASLIRDSVVSGIKEAFPATNGTNKRKRPLANESSENVDDDYDDVDIYDDMPEVGLDAVLGADVNDSEYEDLVEGEDDPDHSFVPGHENSSRNVEEAASPFSASVLCK